jgi:hypothetical protein
MCLVAIYHYASSGTSNHKTGRMVQDIKELQGQDRCNYSITGPKVGPSQSVTK